MRKTIHSEQQRVLVELLREIRREGNVRQTELAEMLGRPQSFVSKYEAGERRVDLIELRAIAEALGVRLIDVVERFERQLAAQTRAPKRTSKARRA